MFRGDRFGYFSLPGFTSDPELPEILVKMVDARALPGDGFWVFFGGLTDVTYALTVADTWTGELRLYANSPGAPFCGGADTAAFAGVSGPGDTAADPSAAAALSGSGATLSLLDARFHLTLSATDPRSGRTTSGTAIPGDDRSGYFSLPAFTGDADFPEVFVKMVDATSVFGDFWLFHTGLTDLAYTLTLDDSVTGAISDLRKARRRLLRRRGHPRHEAVNHAPPNPIDAANSVSAKRASGSIHRAWQAKPAAPTISAISSGSYL